ncbi:MAG: response regulator [Epsilonproteobacteria bacterium]|jgi:CheY-like chemotaxis protein|nr:response regulator [Campylobacterota bacterium]NPA89811.1 response regulator [Campylobacterota bacterium]
MKFLIVDDDEVTRKYLKNVLKRFGGEIIEASNGAEALKKVDEDVDLILLDVIMPILDGITFLKVLKVLNKNPPPVIVVTIDDTRKEELKKLGVESVIIKPIFIEDIIKQIAQVMEERSNQNIQQHN